MNNEIDKFNLVISSDLSYEKMVVELNFGNNTVAILNSDKGEDNTEIEIVDNRVDKVIWKFNYFDFIKNLEKAFKKLKEINQDLE